MVSGPPVLRYHPSVRETALITGASGGLGERFAWLFARGGFDLVIVARQKDKLQSLAEEIFRGTGRTAHVICADLSTQEGVDAVLEDVHRHRLEISVLVNNAGFGTYGPFQEGDFGKEHDLLQVNVVALTALTKGLLPPMVARGKGRILNVASLAAFMPGPGMAVYYASKAYVLSFSEAVRAELSGTGVTVTCLCPGPTETGFADAADVKKSRLFTSAVMDAETVARIGYDACMKGKGTIVSGWHHQFSAFATRFAPRAFTAWMAGKANGR